VRSCIPAYELVAPRNLAAALDLLASAPGTWKPFAGGTDLMVLLEAGKLPHRRFVNLWGLPELRGIAESAGDLTLGALTTYTEIRRNSTLAREFPLLCAAAAEAGAVATQNRGTLGGNIANASPAADAPPALLVYDAELELLSARGSRWVPYHGFHSGYKQMDLREGEIISRIRIPRNKAAWRHYYRKVGTRRAQAISKVCFAAALRMEVGTIRDVRIALASVAPIPLRGVATETILRGQTLSPALIAAAQSALAREIAPIDDLRSTARYRRRVAQNLLRAFLDLR
jgi:CO/xanthine dehydrogenase FAD-binding subunit